MSGDDDTDGKDQKAPAVSGYDDTALSEEAGLAETELPTETGGAGGAGRTRYRPLDVGSRVGRLELIELLGEGGMATVFRARDRKLGRDVAVKVLFPHLARREEVVKRFHREARAAAGLDHPNILRVLDVGGGPETAGDDGACDPPYMVLELIEGTSLRDLVRDGPLVAEAVAAIGAVLCRALAIAHERGIIHRDIKPANVMVDGGRLVLADFGVAQMSGEDSIVTRTGALLGTPAFMSPEQATAEDLDGRSDLYSVGATLYQLATGSMPFSGSTAVVVAAILSGDYVKPLRREPKIGPEMAELIEALMSIEPDDRPATAAETEARLLEIAGTDDPDGVIAELLEDLDVAQTRLASRAVERSLEAAERSAAEGRVPRAISWADRVLAFEPDNPRALALIDELSAGGRRWPLFAGGALGLAACGALVAWQIGVFDGAAPEPAPDAAAVDAAIADAAVAEVDGAIPEAIDAAPTPVDAARPDRNSDRPGRNGDRPPRPIDAAPRPVPVDAEPPPEPDAAVTVEPVEPATGALVVKFPRIKCRLAIDGQSRGTHFARASFDALPAGAHQIRCEHEFGAPVTRQVTVTGGKTQTLTLTVKVAVTNNTSRQIRANGQVFPRGARFRVIPGTVRFESLETDGWKRSSVRVRGDCTLRGPPYHCR